MLVKKFTGATVSEAFARARVELGDEALLLGTRPVNSGAEVRRRVEITVAAERPQPSAARRAVKATAADAPAPASDPRPAPDPGSRPETGSPLDPEFEQLSRRLDRVSATLREPGKARGGRFHAPPPGEIVTRLVEIGLDQPLAVRAAARAAGRTEWASLRDEESLVKLLADSLAESLPPAGPSSAARPGRSIVAFVGPPGAGKTTTLAKIAARESIAGVRTLAVVAADDRRLGAVAELSEMSLLIGVPCHPAEPAGGLRAALARCAEADLVLVDTSGIGSSDVTRLFELREQLEGAGEIGTVLVLPATMRRRDLDRVIDRFRGWGEQRLAFTRLDETMSLGEIFGASVSAGRAPAWLAGGPSIADDLLEASPGMFADVVIRCAFPGRSDA